jgi:putative ABC transport system permease protein
MRILLRDFRFAARGLRKNLGFTSVAVFALALGIGANTAIFSLANAVLLRKMPYQKSGRLVWLAETNPLRGWNRTGVSAPDFLDIQRQNQSFQSMAAFQAANYNITEISPGAAPAERVRAGVVSVNLFDLISAKPDLGRTFLPQEGQPEQNKVTVLSYRFWKSRYNLDAKVLGRTLKLNGEVYTVIGVMPEVFEFPPKASTDALWIPQTFSAEERSDAARGKRYLDVWAELRPGVTVERATAELAAIARHLADEHPVTNGGFSARVGRMSEWYLSNFRRMILLLLAAVGLLLLMACSNVANLLVAKATARQKEVATRLAIGASRLQIIRQLLMESLLLSGLGGIAGLLLAVWGTHVLQTYLPPNSYRVGQIDLDMTVLGFAALISLATGVLFGLIPALGVSRTDLNASLKAGGRHGESGFSHKLRSALVIGEIALSGILLTGAGLLVSSFLRLQRTELGFQTNGLLTFRLNLPEAQYGDAGRIVAFETALLDRLQAIPGVESVAVANDIPLVGADNLGRRFMIEGQPRPGAGREPIAMYFMISPQYFRSLGIRIQRGRAFDGQDMPASLGVAIVDETFVSEYLRGQDPVGKHLRILGPVFGRPDYSGTDVLAIVGVVAATKQFSPADRLFPHIYVPFVQRPWPRLAAAVHARQLTGNFTDNLRQQLREIDSEQPAFSLTTLTEQLNDSLAQNRWNLILMSTIASLAVLLAALGVYGVMAYFVARHTREIGLRMALGAKRSDVVRMVLRQALILATVGLATGLGGAIVLTRAMTSFLYEVKPNDPAVFVAVCLFLLVAAIGASAVPAWRATNVDPIIALRYE